MKGTGGATCGQLSIWDRLTRVKVLPLWRAPFIRGDLERVLRRERRDYVEGHAGRAPVTPNFDPIRQAIDSVPLCGSLRGYTGGKKIEVNIRHTGRATCDLKNDPIRASHRPSGTPPCPVAL